MPIGFQGGLTGALFTEFAFTLVGAVTVSAVIALTLSPMMCSRLLKPHHAEARDWEARLVRFIDVRFEKLLHWYQRKLERSLRYTPVTAVLVLLVLGSIYFMYIECQERTGAAGRPRLHHDASDERPRRRRSQQQVRERR